MVDIIVNLGCQQQNKNNNNNKKTQTTQTVLDKQTVRWLKSLKGQDV